MIMSDLHHRLHVIIEMRRFSLTYESCRQNRGVPVDSREMD